MFGKEVANNFFIQPAPPFRFSTRIFEYPRPTYVHIWFRIYFYICLAFIANVNIAYIPTFMWAHEYIQKPYRKSTQIKIWVFVDIFGILKWAGRKGLYIKVRESYLLKSFNENTRRKRLRKRKWNLNVLLVVDDETKQ